MYYILFETFNFVADKYKGTLSAILAIKICIASTRHLENKIVWGTLSWPEGTLQTYIENNIDEIIFKYHLF